ncbi:MAG: hypothetical protein IPO92_19395 [Saprospiraceae bacterium]|nr:hypothetical protein [Saprospiraceae bacterium]
MDTKHHSKLIQKASQHQVAPKDSAWFKLESKLEKSRSSEKIKYYRNISVAAVLFAILGVVSVFTYEKNTNDKNNSEVYSSHLQLMNPDPEEGIYDIKKLRSLKEAYKRLSTKGKI